MSSNQYSRQAKQGHYLNQIRTISALTDGWQTYRSAARGHHDLLNITINDTIVNTSIQEDVTNRNLARRNDKQSRHRSCAEGFLRIEVG